MINLKDYGAIGDGIADDTAIIQTALDSGEQVYIPEGIYKITDTLVISKTPAYFVGEQFKSIIKCAFSTPRYAIRFSPDTAGIPGHEIGKFAIKHSQYGIELDTTNSNQHIFKLDLHNIFTYGCTRSLKLTNPTNMDGFFTSTIRDNWFDGGIDLMRCGDSVSILRNTITGNGTGIVFSNVVGAAQCVIMSNNMTCKDYSMVLYGGTNQCLIMANQLEKHHTNPTTTDYQIILLGSSSSKVSGCRIKNNNFNTFGKTTYAIVGLVHATNTVVRENVFTTSNLSRHIYVDASCSKTKLTHNDDSSSANVTDYGSTTTII